MAVIQCSLMLNDGSRCEETTDLFQCCMCRHTLKQPARGSGLPQCNDTIQ